MDKNENVTRLDILTSSCDKSKNYISDRGKAFLKWTSDFCLGT